MAFRLSAILLTLLGLLATAREARAEELFVLENGSVLRGVVVRDGPKELLVKLSGFGRDAQVTVERARIVQRYTTEIPSLPPAGWKPEARLVPDAAVPVVAVPAWAADDDASDDSEDLEEPSASGEGFFERMARVSVLGSPKGPSGQVVLLALLLGAVFAVVGMGGRMAEIEALNFPRTLFLALMLVGMLAADVTYRHELLRADRAGWVLPLQAGLWLATAALVLRENVTKLILLFAFVLFSIALLVFVAGAILVTY